MQDSNTILKPGTILDDNYKIEGVIGQGGFGITYIATDMALGRKVAIKEFFPKDFCNRDGETSHVSVGTAGNKELVERLKEKFLKEARNLAKFNNPYIVRVSNAFKANDTAYYVMDFIDGDNLRDIVKRYGPVPPRQAVEYIEKIGSALVYIHSHRINHLDIKPANIMVRRSDNTPILIDFGLSKNYDSSGQQTSTTPSGISHGYAPIEQYDSNGLSEFSPQTDIYSLAATLYYMLTGVTPPQAPRLGDERLEFPGSVPPALQRVISKAMSFGRKNRHQSMEEFLAELKDENTVFMSPLNEDTNVFPSASSADTSYQDSPANHNEEYYVPDFSNDIPKKKNNNVYYIIGAIVVVIAIGIAVWVTGKSNGRTQLSETSEIHKLLSDNVDETPAPQSQSQPSYSDYGGHETVDLGLSVKWAACNLGASDPSDYGEYYVWGITHPGFQYNYCTSNSSICGNPQYDAATAEWGNGWRMPSLAECKELINRCRWSWTNLNGTPGYKVVGPNGNSIFLPAAGYYKDGELEYFTTNGNYWTGNPKGEKAYYISFDDNLSYLECRLLRKDRARSIRPVHD